MLHVCPVNLFRPSLTLENEEVMDEETISYEGTFLLEGGELRPIDISFSVPRRTENHDFKCVVRITGIGDELEKVVYGVDGVQAFCHALNLAKSIIENRLVCRDAQVVYEDRQPFDAFMVVPQTIASDGE
jgi:hypothetical protein